METSLDNRCSTPSTSSSVTTSVDIITEREADDIRLSLTTMFRTHRREGTSQPQRKLKDREYHEQFLRCSSEQAGDKTGQTNEECRTVPLFSGPVLEHSTPDTFNQYGLLASDASQSSPVNLLDATPSRTPDQKDRRIFLNISSPWSAFICGSQGSGKSHTLSCMLENCLHSSRLGKLPRPLTGIVFHYDKFTSYAGNQLCEAAYLCSSGIPVKVLVSPTNFWNMQKKYENLPGLTDGSPKPKVMPFVFKDSQLNVGRMMTLMAVTDNDGPVPLYVESIMRILREMAIASKGKAGLNYLAFRAKLDQEGFTGQQSGPLKLRLQLLESFMEHDASFNKGSLGWDENAWSFEPGTLTIVDLSCPFVDESAACALFSICLELFLENRNSTGRVIALDEAHKFMTATSAASNFTETLLDIIRQQRHLATRIIIATQEPTISPRLLDLSSMTIVHRFTSPQWLRSLRAHLAGASEVAMVDDDFEGSVESNQNMKRDVSQLFAEIVRLNAGEALLFSPSSMMNWISDDSGVSEVNGMVQNLSLNSLGTDSQEVRGSDNSVEASALGKAMKGRPSKMGMKHLKIRIRQRLTADGGKSIMAD